MRSMDPKRPLLVLDDDTIELPDDAYSDAESVVLVSEDEGAATDDFAGASDTSSTIDIADTTIELSSDESAVANSTVELSSDESEEPVPDEAASDASGASRIPGDDGLGSSSSELDDGDSDYWPAVEEESSDSAGDVEGMWNASKRPRFSKK